MAPETDHIELEVLARAYRQRSGLPATLFVNSRNITPAAHLEALAASGKGPAPETVVELLGLNRHVSVATVARLLLDKLRSAGQLPDVAALRPVPVNAIDDVEALRAVARAFRVEVPIPREVRVGGKLIDTTLLLEGFAHDRRECPAGIAVDAGCSNFPASLREVSTTLLGRLKQAGAL